MQLVGDEWATGSSHLLKRHVIHKCLQEYQRMRCLFCSANEDYSNEVKIKGKEMVLRIFLCPFWKQGVAKDGFRILLRKEEGGVLLKTLGGLSQHLCLVSMDQGGVQGVG